MSKENKRHIKDIIKGKHTPESEQFIRYLNGEMSTDEENLMEQQLLEDDFYEEALEGMAEHGDVKTHRDNIKALNETISRKTGAPLLKSSGNGKSIKLDFSPRTMAYAASIVGIIGIGLAIFTFSGSDSEHARLASTTPQQDSTPLISSTESSISKTYSVSGNKNANETDSTVTVISSTFSGAGTGEILVADASTTNESLPQPVSPAEAVAAPLVDKGNEGYRLEEAEIEADLEDAEISESDDVGQLATRSLRRASAKSVVGANAEGRADKAKLEKKEATAPPISIAAIYPGGRHRLQKKLKQFEKNANKEGLTETETASVSFLIDKKGKIKNIVLTKATSSKKLNKEIIDMIKDMPKWNPAKEGDTTTDENKVINLSFSP